jgi:hypothetical protein
MERLGAKAKLDSCTSTVRGLLGKSRGGRGEEQGEDQIAHGYLPAAPAPVIPSRARKRNLGGALADRLVDELRVGDGGKDGEAVRLAPGDEQDELAVALDRDVDARERAPFLELGADLGPAVGLRRGPAQRALGGDDRLEAARVASIRPASALRRPPRGCPRRQAANSVRRVLS